MPLPAPGCETALAGETAFAVTLGAEAAYDVPGREAPTTLETSVEVYFPEGRVAGAPVVLSGRGSSGILEVHESILDDMLSAPVWWSGKQGYRDLYLEGELVGPDDGVAARLTCNFGEYGTCEAVLGEAQGNLCPTVDVPPPVLVRPRCSGPSSPLRFSASAPVDPASVSASVSGVSTQVEAVSFPDGSVHVVPVTGFPPNRDYEIALEASDIVGRPFSIEGTHRILETEGFVSDLTFTTAPPPGAVDSCGTWGVLDGALEAYSWSLIDVLVALPEVRAATTLHALVAWEYCRDVRIGVVGSDGSSATVPLETSGLPTAIPLPKRQRLWVTVQAEAWRGDPQGLPAPTCSVRIEDLAFE